jgi:hypothetical protein
MCFDGLLKYIISEPYKFYEAGHSGHAVWGVGLGRLVAGILGSNPAQGRMFVRVFLCCVVLCR